MPNTLFLRFEGPLQSWGERSQWSVRETAPEPTKSGVVGLLACALGWNDDERIAALSSALRIGVRCDVPGTPAPLVDYHTVGGGYDEPQLLTAEGKSKWIQQTGEPHTEPTWRSYLCDASFLVAARMEQPELAPVAIGHVAHSVQNPIWPLYLGRKCCVPTRPVYDGLGDYDSLLEALEDHPTRVLANTRHMMPLLRPRLVLECAPSQSGLVQRRDEMLSRSRRLFAPRYSYETIASRDMRIEHLDLGD